jgi:2-C-methyl-D-erythritol 4-phosphate cytidylyltransferase
MNVGVILAAGKSTRFGFDFPKQLCLVDGKPIVQHSIDTLGRHLDRVIVVTNSDCASKIQAEVVINDKDSRIESLSKALEIIDDCDNILIHDAARPFITDEMVEKLLNSMEHNYHVQYYLKLVNGLSVFNGATWEIPDRENFIELCTPQITKFDYFVKEFTQQIINGNECEILPIVSRSGLNFKLLQGKLRYLRKITYSDDIF